MYRGGRGAGIRAPDVLLRRHICSSRGVSVMSSGRMNSTDSCEGLPLLCGIAVTTPSIDVPITGLTADDVILDVGCGDGRVLVTMAKVLASRGIGIDVSEVRGTCLGWAPRSISWK